jgi:sugar phosphate isomerase/epimerase
MKISLTSVMLPRWDLETTFTKLAEHGYDGIELRCRYNPEDPNAEPANWGRHLTDVSPDNILDKAPQIRELSQKTGVRVAALAPNFTSLKKFSKVPKPLMQTTHLSFALVPKDMIAQNLISINF